MKRSIVIFGASGDLTSRKLIPALYMNFRKKRLPENTQIIGFSRHPFSDDAFREKLKEALLEFSPSEFVEDEWNAFARLLFYHPGSVEKLNDYLALTKRVNTIDGDKADCVFYLAIAAQLYPVVVQKLGESRLLTPMGNDGYRRIIIEKPFGRDQCHGKSPE